MRVMKSCSTCRHCCPFPETIDNRCVYLSTILHFLPCIFRFFFSFFLTYYVRDDIRYDFALQISTSNTFCWSLLWWGSDFHFSFSGFPFWFWQLSKFMATNNRAYILSFAYFRCRRVYVTIVYIFFCFFDL